VAVDASVIILAIVKWHCFTAKPESEEAELAQIGCNTYLKSKPSDCTGYVT
jgi:hypothetical protein